MATNDPPAFTPFPTSIPGGPGSQAFDDLADAKRRRITGIDSINVWVDGVVTGLQVTYTLDTGKTYRAPVRGSKTGKKSRIRLEPDEELIQLSGQGNTGSINSLTLLSTKPDGSVRLHGPFGDGEVSVKRKGKQVKYRMYELIVGGSDDKGFSWYGGKVMAFMGSTKGGRLAGLGVLTAPIVELANGVSATSAMAEEYREVKSGSKGQTKLQQYSAYRSTVTLPSGVKAVTLWAEEQLKVEIDGRRKTLDPVKGVTVKPNALSKITVTVDATDIFVPAIKLCTDQMTDPWQWYNLHPDMPVHEKIAGWDPDTLYANRTKLGIPKKYTKEDCAAVQAAVVNVAKLGLPGEGQADGERKIDTAAMDDQNWVLDLEGTTVDYKPVNKSEAKQVKAEADSVTKTAAASGIGKKFKKLKKKAKKVTKSATKDVAKVVVETSKTKPVKAVTKTVKQAGAGKVVKDAEQLGKNVAKTGQKIGKDVAKGDIEGAAKHLGQGGLQLGKDVTKLGKHAVVTVINVAGEAVEYVLDRTVALGKLMWKFLESVGVKLIKLIEYLVDLLPWKAIKQTQKQLMDVIEGTLQRFVSGGIDAIAADVDEALAWVEDKGTGALDKLTKKLGGKVTPGNDVAKIGTTAGKAAKSVSKQAGGVADKVMKWMSKPLEYINWLLGKLFSNIPLVKQINEVLAKAAKQLRKILDELAEVIINAGKAAPEGLGAAISNLTKIVNKPSDAPALLASAFLQLAKAVVASGVELVRGLAKLAFGALEQLAKVAVEVLTLDLIPGKKKQGKSIFVTIYNAVVGGKTSFLSVLTWLLAIPVTLLHLLFYGKRPDLRLPAKRGSASWEKARAWTAGIAGACELTIAALLNWEEIARGARNRSALQSDPNATPATVSPLRSLGEWSSWILKLLGHSLSAPWYDPANKKSRQGLESFIWSWGVIGLGVDLVALIKGGTQGARWDISNRLEGREGGVVSLILNAIQLVFVAANNIAYKKSALSIISDIAGSVQGVSEGLFMSVQAEPSPEVATVCAVIDGTLGGLAVSTGMADDLA